MKTYAPRKPKRRMSHDDDGAVRKVGSTSTVDQPTAKTAVPRNTGNIVSTRTVKLVLCTFSTTARP